MFILVPCDLAMPTVFLCHRLEGEGVLWMAFEGVPGSAARTCTETARTQQAATNSPPVSFLHRDS